MTRNFKGQVSEFIDRTLNEILTEQAKYIKEGKEIPPELLRLEKELEADRDRQIRERGV